jgi:multimeric flavodoxin WrbA
VKKITAFVGSGRKGYTLRAAEQLGENLRAFGDVEYEVVRLADYRIETCRGCKACFDKGEELCPLKDDRDELIAKIDASDGVVLATPNYSFQVSGYTKTFLDRLGFLYHRPRFFGKTYAPLVAQGIYGGGKILKYLGFVGNGLGFNTVKGSCLATIEPMSAKGRARVRREARRPRRPYPPAPERPRLPESGALRARDVPHVANEDPLHARRPQSRLAPFLGTGLVRVRFLLPDSHRPAQESGGPPR